MLFHFYCLDNPENASKYRVAKLQQHLDWVTRNMDKIRVAGPLKATDGNKIIGSIYVIEADNEQDAQQLLAQDPYHLSSIWQSVTCSEFNDYAGTWVGGKNWPEASTHKTELL